ncbi:MAG: DUF1570 domain-containing protein [Pirellula sp.]|nr:DUF1570 domain-containing protein [Pirellula sp.]
MQIRLRSSSSRFTKRLSGVSQVRHPFAWFNLTAPFLVAVFFLVWAVSGAVRVAAQSPNEDPIATKVVRIAYTTPQGPKSITGELVAERPGLGHLLLNGDGVLVVVSPEQFESLEELGEPLSLTPARELGEKVLEEMPVGSKFFTTEHYVVCYNTTETYARWNASLYEKRLTGFLKFWQSKGLKLQKPRFPLVAMIFATKEDYVTYAKQDFEGSEGTFGYYHQSKNRLASYDLTGVEGVLPAGVKVNRDVLLNTILSRPEAERTVSTVIHEASHQMAFNCGLQTRLGDNPLWLSEGLATFFETPAGIGKLNAFNYANLIQALPGRTPDSLTTLLIEDSRLRNAETTTIAYAESWGLFHFLVHSDPKAMVKYLTLIRKLPIGSPADSKERLALFQACFGEDLEKLERDFLKHIRKIR